ncbi:MAG: hypothetical protein Q7V88_18755 [Actinomycetota bacterium]|nr:hypothetical protein [Actinomycetota bacterium]
MQGPTGADSTIEIDLIDADPSAFGDHADTSQAPAAPRRWSPRRQWSVGVAACAAVAALVGLLAWQPWVRPPEWRELPVQPLAAPTLTGQLVLGRPPGELLHTSHPWSEYTAANEALGFVFARPQSTYDDGRWALFHAVPNRAAPAPPTTDTAAVRGVEADVRLVRVRATVTWGPHEGYDWTVNANRLDEAQVLAFARAVFAVDGRPVIAGSYALGELRPLGGMETLQRVRNLADDLAERALEYPIQPTVLTYATDSAPVRLGSIPAPADALAMAEFVFGSDRGTGRGTAATVHQQPALVLHSRDLGTVVTWMEGGRLLALTGDRPDAEMVALAETVRPATLEEWTAATMAGMPTDGGYIVWSDGNTVLFEDDAIELGSGTGRYGNEWRLTAQQDDPVWFCLSLQGAVQTCSAAANDTDLPQDNWFVDGVRVTLVVTRLGQADVVRVVAGDGTITEYPFVAIDDTRAAVAVLLPTGATYEVITLA